MRPRHIPTDRTPRKTFARQTFAAELPRRGIKQFRNLIGKVFIIGDQESRILSLRDWTQNDKAAGRRLVVELSLCQKILERAKGFEPSTPTLARSCSTTELHPHPRDWR
jgi:hypothetical protein